MVSQHKELHLLLDDAEKLRRYAQSATSKHNALQEALGKARSKHWERKAKEDIERVTSAERERDEAKEEAQIAWLDAVTTGDAKARAEDHLARVQDALAVAEKARRKAEAEVAGLEVEQTSLMLVIGAQKVLF